MEIQRKILCIALLLVVVANGQVPRERFEKASFKLADHSSYASQKKFPKELEKQILTVLAYYPELGDTKIIFRRKKRKTPLTSRPRFFDVFKGKNKRAYVITISTKTKATISPILFDNLSYNAQIGVLAHELGHIVTYKQKSSFEIMGIAFKLLNAKFVDHFEYETDLIAIQHGMGHQLFGWSVFVRKALKIEEWNGISNKGNERYMNPETIKQHMDSLNLYSK